MEGGRCGAQPSYLGLLDTLQWHGYATVRTLCCCSFIVQSLYKFLISLYKMLCMSFTSSACLKFCCIFSSFHSSSCYHCCCCCWHRRCCCCCCCTQHKCHWLSHIAWAYKSHCWGLSFGLSDLLVPTLKFSPCWVCGVWRNLLDDFVIVRLTIKNQLKVPKSTKCHWIYSEAPWWAARAAHCKNHNSCKHIQAYTYKKLPNLYAKNAITKCSLNKIHFNDCILD